VIYQEKNFNKLIGMSGFSENLLENHFSLYKGYVTNTNEALDLLADLTKQERAGSAHYCEVKRRLSWEWNGMRLHELYFSNLGGKGSFNEGTRLSRLIKEQFGGFQKWEYDFKSVGRMRGVGWAVFYHDTVQNRLFNVWINEHDGGHLVGCVPLLVMDVFEHAYMPDYGNNREDYIAAFFENIDWNEVTVRFGIPETIR
jgi:Fe-Mn family superoxide dismutase